MKGHLLLSLLVVLFYFNFDVIESHSWMDIPHPLNPSQCRVDVPGRQINDFGTIHIGRENCPGPCERNTPFNDGTPNRWSRGQGVKVGWVRNGHGKGGAVRWSIVNVDKNDWQNKQTYNERAFEVTCFVQTLESCGGNCGTDTFRFTATLTIPKTLPDGRYRLQWVWFGGPDPSINGNFGDYYSCTDVVIANGPFESTHNVPPGPVCSSIVTKVGECAQEPCRNGQGPTDKKITEIPDGTSLSTALWGGSGGAAAAPAPAGNGGNGGNGGGGNGDNGPPPGPYGRYWPRHGGTFDIHPMNAPDLCLEAAGTWNGAHVQLAPCNAQPNQKWTIQDTGMGLSFISKASGRCLDIWMGNEQGKQGQIWDFGAGANQRFVAKDMREYQYALMVQQGGGWMALDVVNWGNSPGTRVQQWGFGGQANQKWVFTSA